jgi:16S rRNA G527 N7-methylase RsmG
MPVLQLERQQLRRMQKLYKLINSFAGKLKLVSYTTKDRFYKG